VNVSKGEYVPTEDEKSSRIFGGDLRAVEGGNVEE
jgi:hypothetical protein